MSFVLIVVVDNVVMLSFDYFEQVEVQFVCVVVDNCVVGLVAVIIENGEFVLIYIYGEVFVGSG